MIEFRCKNCGQKISTPKIHAGKKGKCPRCKNAIVVPKIEPAEQTDSTISLSKAGSDLTFLDIPPKSEVKIKETAEDSHPEKTFEEIYGYEQKRVIDDERTAKRKHPWIIDIFLYPTSVPGLTILGILVGVPLLVRILVTISELLALKLPPMFVFVLLFKYLGFIVQIVIGLYIFWYCCECVRDSAAGGLRAPETMANTPGFAEMLWQLTRILGCLAFFALPAVLYSHYTSQHNGIYTNSPKKVRVRCILPDRQI